MLALLFVLFAHAESPLQRNLEQVIDDFHFLSPNEVDNYEQDRLWNMALDEGVHVSVGSERGFMGAAANEYALAVILIDRDPAIVAFNLINIALLKAARTRDDYLALRFAKTPAEWGRANLPASAWDFWQTHVVLSRRFERFHADNDGFARNYLHDAKAFARVSDLAKADRIFASRAYLERRSDLRQIVDMLKRLRLRINLLDISNVAGEPYLAHPEDVELALRVLGRETTANALLVTSRLLQRKFIYVAYRFARIRLAPKRAARYLVAMSEKPLRKGELNPDPVEFRELARGFCDRILDRLRDRR